MVTSRSGLTTVVLKNLSYCLTLDKWEQLPGCIPSACQQLVTHCQSQRWPRQPGSSALQAPGWPPQQGATSCKHMGSTQGRGTPVSVPGLADAEEEHRVPGTLSWSPFKQLFVPPWVVCAGESAPRVQV